MPQYNQTIAVTGMNATDNPGPGVGVIRSIRQTKEFTGKIVGLGYEPLDPGLYMDGICDDSYLFPYPSEGQKAILNRLSDIQQKTPIDVIIPSLDSELGAFIRIEDELHAMGIRMFLPKEADLKLRSKATFSRLSQEHGIKIPKTKAITDIQAIYKLEEEFNFPVMVKGQFYEAYFAHSPIEAETLFRSLSGKWGLPIIIQEFIGGEEYDVVALGDGEGGLIGAVPMRKLQLTDKGKAWGGVTIGDENILHFVRETVAKLRWRGPAEFEVMKRKKDGQYYLLEINPRFPAWSYLSAGAGQNLPFATVKLALGESVLPFESYEVGTMFLRHSVDMIYDMKQYQEITTNGETHQRKDQ